MEPTTVLLPLRAPGEGKTRLGPALGPDQRAALVAAMLADVVSALREAGLEDLQVVAADLTAVRTARTIGLPSTMQPTDEPGLDPAIRAAGDRLGSGRSALVVTPDLPCLTAGDVRAVLQADAEVVVAPTTGGGTGALLRRPHDAIGPAYGPGSAERHLARARAVGHRTAVVERTGWRHDIDTAADLAALRHHAPGAMTAALLPELLTGTAAAG